MKAKMKINGQEVEIEGDANEVRSVIFGEMPKVATSSAIRNKERMWMGEKRVLYKGVLGESLYDTIKRNIEGKTPSSELRNEIAIKIATRMKDAGCSLNEARLRNRIKQTYDNVISDTTSKVKPDG